MADSTTNNKLGSSTNEKENKIPNSTPNMKEKPNPSSNLKRKPDSSPNLKRKPDSSTNLKRKPEEKGSKPDLTKKEKGKKKLSRKEMKLYVKKHEDCVHKCVKVIEKSRIKGCECEDCNLECYYGGHGIFCLTFRELCGDAPFSPMSWGDQSPDEVKVIRPIVKHVCNEH